MPTWEFTICIPCMWTDGHHKSQRFAETDTVGDFPGGLVVKNLPANAGDMGSIPGPGRSHMPQSNEARVPQLLKPACPRALET